VLSEIVLHVVFHNCFRGLSQPVGDCADIGVVVSLPGAKNPAPLGPVGERSNPRRGTGRANSANSGSASESTVSWPYCCRTDEVTSTSPGKAGTCLNKSVGASVAEPRPGTTASGRKKTSGMGALFS